MELVRLNTQSTREVDASISWEFLERIENLSQEYEKRYITSMVELMEVYEKPVLGVSLANTGEGTVRPIPGKRYSGVFYQTPENAVSVLSRMVGYRQFIERQ